MDLSRELALSLLLCRRAAAEVMSVYRTDFSVAGFGMGLAYAPLSAASLSQCEPGREGAATSALQLSDVTGVTVGTGLAGVLLASDVWDGSLGAGLAAVWSFATAVAVLGVIGSRGLPGPRTVV